MCDQKEEYTSHHLIFLTKTPFIWAEKTRRVENLTLRRSHVGGIWLSDWEKCLPYIALPFDKLTLRIFTPACQSPNCKLSPLSRSSAVYPFDTEAMTFTALPIINWSPVNSCGSHERWARLGKYVWNCFRMARISSLTFLFLNITPKGT